jgi:hypothetical protein
MSGAGKDKRPKDWAQKTAGRPAQNAPLLSVIFAVNMSFRHSPLPENGAGAVSRLLSAEFALVTYSSVAAIKNKLFKLGGSKSPT